MKLYTHSKASIICTALIFLKWHASFDNIICRYNLDANLCVSIITVLLTDSYKKYLLHTLGLFWYIIRLMALSCRSVNFIDIQSDELCKHVFQGTFVLRDYEYIRLVFGSIKLSFFILRLRDQSKIVKRLSINQNWVIQLVDENLVWFFDSE